MRKLNGQSKESTMQQTTQGMTQDEQYMQQAIALAKKGCGYVAPNPMVGAVIVKDGKVLGQGYHECYGKLHAERNALANCKETPKGATIYVTLEPCCHYGKTPPCTEAIIENGIARVVIGSRDPNPLVAGKGIEQLRAKGIQITEGVCKEDCLALNEVFFHYIQAKTPYVVMKYAMTMDGKIATRTGESKWITGETARERVQQDRHRYTGIMVGIGTVLADDPLLTCRLPNGKSPIRIICDTGLRIPLTAKLVQTAKDVRTIILTCCQDAEKKKQYLEKGCRIAEVPMKEEHVDMREAMRLLASEGIDSILLEGGGTLNWSCLQAGIVQKVQCYIAPKLFGGADAKSPIGGLGIEHPSDCTYVTEQSIQQIGEDILIESKVKACLRGL